MKNTKRPNYRKYPAWVLGCLCTWVLLCDANAAQIVTATVTVTNAPAIDGNTLTVNGSTRTWRTSVTAPSTEILIASTIGGSATNLYSQAAAYPFTTLLLSRSGTNGIVLRGIVDQAIAASLTGTWGQIVLSTQSVTSLTVVRVPINGEPSAVARTNIPSLLVLDLNLLAKNSLSQTGIVSAELIGLTNTQTITAKKTWTGSNVFGLIVTTNLVNQGNAVSSKGSGTDSEQFGTGALATNVNALAVGQSALAYGVSAAAFGNTATVSAAANNGTAIGNFSTVTREQGTALGSAAAASGASATAIGQSAEASATNALAIGVSSLAGANDSISIGNISEATATNGIAIGSGASANFANSVALGYQAAAAATNQVRLGSANDTVSIPGKLAVTGTTALTGVTTAGVVTNATYHGTVGLLTGGNLQSTTTSNLTHKGITTDSSEHIFNAQIRRAMLTHTALANGNNAAVDFLTNSFVKISAGPTAAFAINGITGGTQGRELIIYNSIAQNMTIANESGVDATPANRIVTMTGADVISTAAGAAHLIYDSGASRWLLLYLTQ